MSDSERKKILRKAKKAEVKAASAASSTPSVSNTATSTTDASSATKKVDEDPLGLKFMVDFDHVNEAFKFLKSLLSLLPDDLDVIELACRAYFAKGIVFLVVR